MESRALQEIEEIANRIALDCRNFEMENWSVEGFSLTVEDSLDDIRDGLGLLEQEFLTKESERLIEEGERFLIEYPEDLNEREYIAARVGSNSYCLINLTTGNRLLESCPKHNFKISYFNENCTMSSIKRIK